MEDTYFAYKATITSSSNSNNIHETNVINASFVKNIAGNFSKYPLLPCILPNTCCNDQLENIYRLPHKTIVLSNYSNSSTAIFNCGRTSGFNLTIDLGGHFRICSTTLHFAYGNMPSKLDFSGSHDGNIWTAITTRAIDCNANPMVYTVR